MIPARIPVVVISRIAAEVQAFADVFANGAAGAVCLAQDEPPLVALICPSGELAQVPEGVVGVVKLGEGGMGCPARLVDIISAIEQMVVAGVLSGQKRLFEGWVLEGVRLEKPSGEMLMLTDTEARLLACLFGGDEVSRAELLQKVWGYRPGLDTHTLETHIYRLRQKIEINPAVPQFVVTTEQGYRLCGADRDNI